MNIIVCVKAIPGFIQNPAVSETGDRVEYEAGSIVINESDDYALEAAVKLAKDTGGTTKVITAGSLSSQKVLQAGLAKDADSAVRIDANLFDPTVTARVLAAAIKKHDFDLIITGVESRDVMAAQVGISLAELLGLPFAYAVVGMEKGQKENTIRITKELGFGKKQVEEIDLPALVCFQTSTDPVSFVPFRKMMMAQRKPIETVSIKSLEMKDIAGSVRIIDIFSPQEMSHAEMIEGTPAEQAEKLMKKIKEVI
ncbi:MAG: electron transfer flavoprotein subunit beta/FixA family protein [Deltaproteobacteria bacterium]|nr:electron transfer flavoprotein subunit beta/FixA family protein [Deltaproteobacteria bacterium]